MGTNELVVRRFEELLRKAEGIADTKELGHLSGYYVALGPFEEWTTSVQSLLERVLGEDSIHCSNFRRIRHADTAVGSATTFLMLKGVLKAAKEDYEGGYLFRLEGLVAADLFMDFLDMAQHLLEQGYKDPAAVLVGGVLEEHLRKLCVCNGIDTQLTDAKGKTRAKPAESMNVELAGASIYSKIEQQSVTAWLALRNRAAHGKYGEYDSEQVGDMLSNVRHFITRNPI